MLTFNVTTNIAETIKKLQAQQKQISFGISRGLTWTARDVRQDVMTAMPQVIDRPAPFTMRGIGYTPATRTNLVASVFVRDAQAKYLKRTIVGGTRLPRGKALLVPTSEFPRDQYGNPSKAALKRLRTRKDVFAGTIHGVPGIYQRTGRGRAKGIKLLVGFERQTQYDNPTFDFVGIARASIKRHLQRNIERSIADALATAR
jgi:hypothetical protein